MTKPRPNQPFQWTVECQWAFEMLKGLFAMSQSSSTPILNDPLLFKQVPVM